MSSRRRLGLAAVAAVLAALAPAAPAGAIVGGAPAPAGRWPWTVALLDNDLSPVPLAQFCGGVLIAPRRVLTAAHCVVETDPGQVDVLIGRLRLSEAGGRRLHATAISLFPGWVDESQPGLDAALITLSADAGVAPVALARPGQEALFGAGAQAWTMGWGRLNARPSPGGSRFYADRLRELAVPIAGDDACERVYGIGLPNDPYRPAWTLCGGPADGRAGTCFGDSGGPLVVETPGGWVSVGIVTGGDACAAPVYFDWYARVDRISRFALAAAPVAQPSVVARPRVVGRVAAGRRVSCALGRWRGHPTRFAVTWTRRERPRRVLGRHARLRLTAADARHGVRCAVTASNRGGRLTERSRAR